MFSGEPERKPLVVVGSINADLVIELERLPKVGCKGWHGRGCLGASGGASGAPAAALAVPEKPPALVAVGSVSANLVSDVGMAADQALEA